MTKLANWCEVEEGGHRFWSLLVLYGNMRLSVIKSSDRMSSPIRIRNRESGIENQVHRMVPKLVPSDGVDRDTGGESGHLLKMSLLALGSF